jgi:hypothetical protein
MLDVLRKRRESCARAVVALIGIRRFRLTLLNTNPTDIILLLARTLWATRRNEAWSPPCPEHLMSALCIFPSARVTACEKL